MTLPDSQFVDLACHRQVTAPGRLRGNVIKAAGVTVTEQPQDTPPPADPGKPAIVLHKEGDRVTHAEFICECGRTTTLQLEDEQE